MALSGMGLRLCTVYFFRFWGTLRGMIHAGMRDTPTLCIHFRRWRVLLLLFLVSLF